MKITRNQVVELYEALEQLAGVSNNRWLTYGISRNRSRLRSEIDAIRKAQEAPVEFQRFSAKRSELLMKHAVKDSTGEPKVAGNNFVMTDYKAFQTEMDSLREEYKDAIAAYEEMQGPLKVFMAEEVEITPYKMQTSWLFGEKSLTTEKDVGLFLELMVDTVFEGDPPAEISRA